MDLHNQTLELLEQTATNWTVNKLPLVSQDVYSMGKWDRRYKIIIPKEEPKQRLEKYSERFDNKDNEIVQGVFNPENWGKRLVKDKPKQDRTCANNCSVVCGECQIFEAKQETFEDNKQARYVRQYIR